MPVTYDIACETCGETQATMFASSDAYEKLRRLKQVACGLCGSPRVERRFPAPAVHTSGDKSVKPVQQENNPTDTREELAKARAWVEANTEDVGSKFAETAIAIEEGKEPERGIRGTSTVEDAQRLNDKGIPFGILPNLKHDA